MCAVFSSTLPEMTDKFGRIRIFFTIIKYVWFYAAKGMVSHGNTIPFAGSNVSFCKVKRNVLITH